MDFISNFNGLELVFIVILAILLFGPEKIPEIAAKLGSWARTLRNLSSQVMADLREETGLSEITGEENPLSSSLDQTMADIKSSVNTIQSPIQSIKESLTEQLEPADISEKINQESTTRTELQGSADKKRDMLEKRLQTLEKQLGEIRTELAKTDPESAEGRND